MFVFYLECSKKGKSFIGQLAHGRKGKDNEQKENIISNDSKISLLSCEILQQNRKINTLEHRLNWKIDKKKNPPSIFQWTCHRLLICTKKEKVDQIPHVTNYHEDQGYVDVQKHFPLLQRSTADVKKTQRQYLMA